MRFRKINMRKSNVIIAAIISITAILLGFAFMSFVNNYNAASATTPVAENNPYYAPGFEEDEALDENMKSISTDINAAKGTDGALSEFRISTSSEESESNTAENPEIQPSEKQNAHMLSLLKSYGLTNSSVSEAATTQAGDFLLGDVDCSGEINIADATHIQKMIAYLIESTSESFALADVNADNSVNIDDATLIQLYCCGLIDSFVGSEPATEPTKPAEDTTSDTTPSTSDEDVADLPPKAPSQNGEWGASVNN